MHAHGPHVIFLNLKWRRVVCAKHSFGSVVCFSKADDSVSQKPSNYVLKTHLYDGSINIKSV